MGATAPQNHVYDCHIVEHEDNDMMRPFPRHRLIDGRARASSGRRSQTTGLEIETPPRKQR